MQIVDCETDIKGVDLGTDNEHCRSQNDSLVDRHDVQNHLSYLEGLRPIWSSVKGHYTPRIAYRGCFREVVSSYQQGHT